MVLRDASDICLWFTYIERVAKQGLHTSSTTQRREATFWFIMHCITTTVTQIRYMYYSNLELCVTCHAGCTLKVCHCKEGSPPRTCSIINCQSEKPSPLPLWLHTTIAQFQRHAGNNTRWNLAVCFYPQRLVAVPGAARSCDLHWYWATEAGLPPPEACQWRKTRSGSGTSIYFNNWDSITPLQIGWSYCIIGF